MYQCCDSQLCGCCIKYETSARVSAVSKWFLLLDHITLQQISNHVHYIFQWRLPDFFWFWSLWFSANKKTWRGLEVVHFVMVWLFLCLFFKDIYLVNVEYSASFIVLSRKNQQKYELYKIKMNINKKKLVTAILSIDS